MQSFLFQTGSIVAASREPDFVAICEHLHQNLALAGLIGFEVRQNGQLDDVTRASLSAFQMKYRPARYDGVPDAETAALLEVCTRPSGSVLKGVDGQWHPYQTPQ
jgi:N-acetyl-anhydromuramyl-L-alanine amidase AmpD